MGVASVEEDLRRGEGTPTRRFLVPAGRWTAVGEEHVPRPSFGRGPTWSPSRTRRRPETGL